MEDGQAQTGGTDGVLPPGDGARSSAGGRSRSSMAQWEAAGLYDPDAPDAAERAALLEHLASLGLTVDDVLHAAAAGRLDRQGADHVLWGDGGPALTAQAIAERWSLDDRTVRSVLRSVGLPDPGDRAMFREAHADVFAGFALGASIFGDEALMQFTRVLSAAAERVADAAVTLFAATVTPRLDSEDATPLERVRSAADAVNAFRITTPVMDVLLREHFTNAIRRYGWLDIGEGGVTPMGIAFVDLVGSTQLAQVMSSSELNRALSDFENAAIDAAVGHDCRVVKLIGDEVMLAGDTATLLAAVTDVLDAVDAHAHLVGARAGMTSGSVLPRDGDYFGPSVNLAARLVKIAAPGEFLADEPTGDVAEAKGYVVKAAGERALKGFDETVAVWSITR